MSASLPAGIRLLASAGDGPLRSDADRLLMELANGETGIPSDSADIRLHRPDQSRPRLFIGREEKPVSLTHTTGILIAAIGQEGWLGVDAEHIDRIVHEGLRTRILHPEEASDPELAALPTLRIWTMKEAVLKWMGTGLRTPMSSLRIRSLSPELFMADILEHGQVRLASFQWEGYWISVAWSAGCSDQPAGLATADSAVAAYSAATSDSVTAYSAATTSDLVS